MEYYGGNVFAPDLAPGCPSSKRDSKPIAAGRHTDLVTYLTIPYVEDCSGENEQAEKRCRKWQARGVDQHEPN